MNGKSAIAAFAALSVISAPSLALAHGGGMGVVKERMELMEAMGDAMDQVTAMMRGKISYEVAAVQSLATQIGDHGGDAITSLFPEGSLDPPTEALPAIWTDWESFEDLSAQLTDYASALAAAAGNDRAHGGGHAMMGGQGMMGGSDMMMTGQVAAPSAENLAQMPPDAAFMQLAQTCSGCHEVFREEQ